MHDKKHLIEELNNKVIELLVLIIIYFVSNKYFSNYIANFKTIWNLNDDMISSFKGIIVILVTYIISFVVIRLARFFARPIKIKIGLKNLVSEKEFTEIYHFDGPTREDSRNVCININVLDTGSYWQKLALKTINNKNIKININVEPNDIGLLCVPTVIGQEILVTESAFSINLNNLVRSNLQSQVPLSKEYIFSIREHRDNPPNNNGTYAIKPILLVNDNELGYFMKKLFEYIIVLEKGYYEVKFYK